MKSHRQWIGRLLCLVMVFSIGMIYQQRALAWQDLQEENEQAVQAAETHNREVLAAEAAAKGESALMYQEGTFRGEGSGYGGSIAVNVTIAADTITEITIESADNEDEAYMNEAVRIIDSIVSSQSTDVDTVSGATMSSAGIREAVWNALNSARKQG